MRLESDEDLVKVITIHKPARVWSTRWSACLLRTATAWWTADKAAVLQVSDAGKGDRRIGRWTFDKQDAQSCADLDRLREDLRLWYVALTRARHALVAGLERGQTRQSGKTCVNHDSAAGHLLSGKAKRTGGYRLGPPSWQALQTDAQGQPLSVQFTRARE